MEWYRKGGAVNALNILKSDHAHLRWILYYLQKGISGELQFSKGDYISWLDFLTVSLKAHMEREERYLFKFLRQAMRDGMKSYHSDEEHQEIQRAIQILMGLLHQGEVLPREALTSYGSYLINTLRLHMEYEENVVYPRAEKELGEALLQAVSPLIVQAS